MKFVTAGLTVLFLATAALWAGSVHAQQDQSPTPGKAGNQAQPPAPSQPAAPGMTGNQPQSPAPSQPATPGQTGAQPQPAAPGQAATPGQTEIQSQTPAASQTFAFKVCNKTKRSASVAIAARVSPDGAWYTQGWWAVSAGECSTIGTFANGWFYYYAKSATGDWHGTDGNLSKTCVRSGAFKRSDPDGYQCASGETLVAFNGKQISGDTFTWTLQ